MACFLLESTNTTTCSLSRHLCLLKHAYVRVYPSTTCCIRMSTTCVPDTTKGHPPDTKRRCILYEHRFYTIYFKLFLQCAVLCHHSSKFCYIFQSCRLQRRTITILHEMFYIFTCNSLLELRMLILIYLCMHITYLFNSSVQCTHSACKSMQSFSG